MAYNSLNVYKNKSSKNKLKQQKETTIGTHAEEKEKTGTVLFKPNK